jgi:HAD superfamily hydrolase (TIGR01509 family)
MVSEPVTVAAFSWLRAAVFDFDGLLVDTGACWQRAYVETLARGGRALEPGALDALAGASVAQAAAQLTVPMNDLHRELARAFQERRPAALPGARELVERLRQRVPLAVATNGPAEIVAASLGDVGLLESFEFIVSAETPPYREKPAPDVYRAACERLGVTPEETVAFEDSPIGALAAQRAGLVVVYVPSDGQPSSDAHLRVSRLDDPRLLEFLAEP